MQPEKEDQELIDHMKICTCDPSIFPINARKVLNVLGDGASNGWWDWHLKEDFEYISPGYWHFLGYDSDEMPHNPESWMSLINKKDLTEWINEFEEQVEKGDHDVNVSRVVRYRKKCGEIAHVICQGKVIEWDGDEPVRMIGTHTDVTKEVKVQETLEQEQKLLDDFFSATPTGIAICNPDGSFLKVNDAFCKIVGHSKPNLLKGGWQNITHQEDVKKDQELMLSVLKQKIDKFEISKKRYIRSDGSISYAHLVVVALRDGQGNIKQFFGQVIDKNEQQERTQKITNTIEDIQGLLEKQTEKIQTLN